MADWVYPEDEGTGATEGDWTDAANFASAFDAIGAREFVSDGLEFTLDAATPSLSISEGKAVVVDTSASTQDHSGDGGRGVETRDDGVSYVVEATARSGLSLTDSAVNHVYLNVDLTSDDSISYHIDTNDTPPSARPYLKIGEVDTTNDTTTPVNRSSAWTFEYTRARHGAGITNAMHHTSFENNISNVEIARYDLFNDEQLEVYRLECPKQGGGTVDTGVTLDVYDEGTGTVLESVNANERLRTYEPSNAATSGTGNSVIVRISNSSGAAVSVGPMWRLAVVKSY